MATTSGGKSPSEESMAQITEGEINHTENTTKYVVLLKPKVHIHENPRITAKILVMIHGEPSIIWKASEVQNMII